MESRAMSLAHLRPRLLSAVDDLDGNRASPQQRASARLFATLVAGWLNWFAVLRTDRGGDEEAAAVGKLRENLRAMNAFLVQCRERDGSDGPFLCGERFSIAEAATAPFAMRLATVLPGMRPELGEPLSWMKEEGLSEAQRWLEAVCSRPSCVETLPPKSELVESYTRLLERMQGAGPPAR
jgi:glutathione S-transferase